MTGGQLTALVLLGVFHGINPGMGWLFAVARGLQERSRRALLWSLPAIAAGHEASVAIVAVAVTVTGSVLASHVLSIGGGLLLVGFGMWRLLSRRHFRWVGMRLSLWQLAGWSFLMSSVHGAGLMLLPVLTGGHGGHDHGAMDQAGMGHGMASMGQDMLSAAGQGLAAAALHGAAMLVTAGVVALAVYDIVGLSVIRRAWVNLDRLWAFALVGAGAATLLFG